MLHLNRDVVGKVQIFFRSLRINLLPQVRKSKSHGHQNQVLKKCESTLYRRYKKKWLVDIQSPQLTLAPPVAKSDQITGAA